MTVSGPVPYGLVGYGLFGAHHAGRHRGGGEAAGRLIALVARSVASLTHVGYLFGVVSRLLQAC